MKKSEARTGNKPKRITKVVTKPKSRKVTAAKSLPGEEEISRKAYEIYRERISRGEAGTESDDWQKAVALLRNS